MRLVIQVLAFLFLTVPVKLIENAILGWGDDLIAKSLGITSPTLADVATFAWRWGIPLLTLALLFWWYNVSYSRKANAITVGSAQPVWVQAVLPGLIALPDAARRVYEKFRHKPLENYIDRNFGGDTDQMLNVLAGHIAGTTVVLPTSIAALRVTMTPMTCNVVPAGMSDLAIATLSPGARIRTRGSVFICYLKKKD